MVPFYKLYKSSLRLAMFSSKKAFGFIFMLYLCIPKFGIDYKGYKLQDQWTG